MMLRIRRLLPDERATERLGDDLAAALKPGDLVALRGDLGAGKTALARQIIRAMADDPELEVPSPTFTLVQSYRLRIPIHHFDLYRLTGPDELEELGLSEALAEGIVIVEWPERAPDLFDAALSVRLREHGEGREAEIHVPPGAEDRFSRSFEIRSFLDGAGYRHARRTYLLGDASIRAYETVHLPDGARFILMDAPERQDEPVVRDGLPYSRIARLAQSVTAFVAVANALRTEGFSTPQIHAQDLERGLLLCEHMGDQPFLEQGTPVRERYLAAARLLAQMHERVWPSSFPVGEGMEHTPPVYDHAALGIETELLLDWYLPHSKNRTASEEERQEFSRVWAVLFDRMARGEQTLVLRDFHSANIIWRQEKAGLDRLGLIDVQDAVFGSAAYDVASLALDARVDISEELEHAIIDAYCAARRSSHFHRASFLEAYAIAAAQRNTKLLGTFVRLARRDGKPDYLRHLPRVRSYLDRALAHPVLAGLAACYGQYGLLGENAE